MPTSLTKEALKEKAQARYEEVTVDGFGVVGIRSVSPVKQSHRASKCFNENGDRVQLEIDRRDVYKLIDQLMIDENTPMFEAADVVWLSECDASRLNPLFEAVRKFNGESLEGNDGSPDSNENSGETTD